jgi:hypothetical protein
MATRSLFLDDHGALFGLFDRVGVSRFPTLGLTIPWSAA